MSVFLWPWNVVTNVLVQHIFVHCIRKQANFHFRLPNCIKRHLFHSVLVMDVALLIRDISWLFMDLLSLLFRYSHCWRKKIGMQSSVFEITNDCNWLIKMRVSNERHETEIKMSNENSLRDLLVRAQSFSVSSFLNSRPCIALLNETAMLCNFPSLLIQRVGILNA